MEKNFPAISLRKEIVLVLVIKLLLIWGIWFLFFSHPVDERLSSDQFAKAIFSINPSSPIPPSTKAGKAHDR